jgi:hypothetical protein
MRAAAVDVAEKDTDEAAGPAVEAPVVEQARPVERAPSAMPKATPGQNPLDYVWLAIAALVAYELGRGTGAKPVEVAEPAEPKAAPPADA